MKFKYYIVFNDFRKNLETKKNYKKPLLLFGEYYVGF